MHYRDELLIQILDILTKPAKYERVTQLDQEKLLTTLTDLKNTYQRDFEAEDE